MSNLKAKLSSLAVAVALVAGITLFPSAAGAGSPAIPFTDPNISGYLTLCDRNGQPVTSGSLLTVPFVWSAVSSSPAPKGYSRAYLTVFQPIEHVDPGNWSGYQLTVVAIFSNASHPIAQATNRDAPLEWPDHSYPPYWNGFYELRMYFAAPNHAPYSSSYPAAIIHVSGDTWTLAKGGTTACNVGKAVSLESIDLPKSMTDTPQSLVVNPNPYNPAAQTSQGITSTTVGGSPPSDTKSVKQAIGAANTRASHEGSGLPVALWVVIALAAAGAAFGGVRLRGKHVRSTSGGGSTGS